MDLPSDSDESDVDFVPDENADDESCPSEKKVVNKRPGGATVPATRSKRSRGENSENGSAASTEKKEIVHSVDKKRDDDLWASFLSAPKEETPPATEEDNSSLSTPVAAESPPAVDDTKKEPPARKPAPPPFAKGARGGGLSSVLGRLGKGNKLSTLEKSKLDWNNFKKEEGIDEELSTHNRGRDGYLERQDFLQRTDLRQFEIEKNIRATRRGNR